MKKTLCILLLCSLLVGLAGCQSGGSSQTEPVTIPEIKDPTIALKTCYDGATVDICSQEIREYLDAQTEEAQIAALLRYSGFDASYQATTFDWDGDGSSSYTVYFADNVNFEDPITVKTTETLLTDYGSFVPGTTYYWKVEGDQAGSASVIDSFTVLDAPVRCIGTQTIRNTRDIGGWTTDDGHTVRYGLIYRCGRTNPDGGSYCNEEDVALFRNELGIVTEIDLRSSDTYGQTESVFGEDVTYLRTPLGGYSVIFPQFSQTEPVARSYDGRSPENLRMIFETLGQEESYPLVFHCNAGADRTGTLAFLIGGVLGVSFEDLTRDFELTSFSVTGARWRSDITEDKTFADYGIQLSDSDNYIGWNQMYEYLMENYATGDGSLKAAIENYLINTCNVDKEDIEFLRKMMIE